MNKTGSFHSILILLIKQTNKHLSNLASFSLSFSLFIASSFPVFRLLLYTSFLPKKLNNMAGMLPGVEAARRRRCHQGGTPAITGAITSSSSSSRRSSFSLFCTNNSSSTPSFVHERSRGQHQVDNHEKLGQVAREAKGRLDERLSLHRKITPPVITSGRLGVVKIRELRMEVYGGAKKAKKKVMGWGNKLGWKAGEQAECTVCLEEYKQGEKLMKLECGHRFHSRCLVPWLETNAHCPCCRMSILS